MSGVAAGIGFDSYADDLSSVGNKGLSDKTCKVLTRINKQSPDIAGGVYVDKVDLEIRPWDSHTEIEPSALKEVAFVRIHC